MEDKASILIVDDNVSLVRTLSFVLKRKGFTVVTARDGLEAIEKVREMPFDIIFLDIKMPIMDGVETHRGIKKIRPEAVVMMMTAYSVEDMVQQALRDGAYGVIYKPLDMDKVMVLIEDSRKTRQGCFIMVVDDDPAICETLNNILTRKGYSVGIAHSGEEALAMARKKSYDVAIIDIKLPVINGLETYLAMKELNPELSAIMMTAYRQEMDDLVEEALRNNAYTCLYKPFEIEGVLKFVNAIQEKQRKAGEKK